MRLMCMCTYKRPASQCSRIAREIGECPRNNLCCWARATSDVPYLDARRALIRRRTVSHRMAREHKGEGRDVSACRSASLSCRRQTRPRFIYTNRVSFPPVRRETPTHAIKARESDKYLFYGSPSNFSQLFNDENNLYIQGITCISKGKHSFAENLYIIYKFI